MKFNNLTGMIAGSILASLSMGGAHAATWDITVTNLTNGNVFTPLYLVAHDHGVGLFTLGQPASAEIELMAECGAISGAGSLELLNAGANAEFAGTTLTMPGATTTGIQLVTDRSHLSVVAMILPTNDAFIGLQQHIPAEPGTYTYFLAGYDAGTESNTEIFTPTNPTPPVEDCPGDTQNIIPGDPGGMASTGGSGVTTPAGMTSDNATPDSNSMVHIHRGVLGDAADETNAGNSDLVNSIHRWQNPVAKVVVTVTR